jgi:hypothetical protein
MMTYGINMPACYRQGVTDLVVLICWIIDLDWLPSVPAWAEHWQCGWQQTVAFNHLIASLDW